MVVKLYFVTGNEHKLLEAREVLKPYGFLVERLRARKLEIQSDSLVEIVKVAVQSLGDVGVPVFVEDAGLFIGALNGFPGPYSAYVYRTIGVSGILKLMEGVENRSAYFESAVALRMPNGEVEVFVERVKGFISTEARGTGGFGFDPIFIPEGHTRTFAEMSLHEKNTLSHRAKALRSMAEWLKRKLRAIS